MKKDLPQNLIGIRFFLGFLILAFALLGIEYYAQTAICLLTIGLITDILDGIIARRLQVSTPQLRRMDSTVDQIFFITVALATYLQYPDFFRSNATRLIILFSSEALIYIVCYLKFQKEVATHSIGAKIWTLTLFATLIDVILNGQSTLWFTICFWLGLISRLEILAILFTLTAWTNDVPSWFHARRAAKNGQMKRNKWFNG